MTELLNRNLLSLGKNPQDELRRLIAETPGCIALVDSEPDFGISDSVKKGVNTALQNGKTHYPPNAGDTGLRYSIAEFENRTHGFNYVTEEVLMTDGSTEAIAVALLGILNPGEEVLIPVPAQSVYTDLVKLAGGVPVYMDTTDEKFQLSAEKLAAAVTEKTKCIILNSPNNPTGVIYNQESLNAVKDIVTGKPIFVLCDDSANRMIYNTLSCPMFASFDDLKDQILVAQSFSNTYAMAGFRMGYLLGAKPVIEMLTKLHAAMVVSVSSICQDACIEAVHSDYYGTLSAYESRVKTICEKLDAMGMEYVVPEGGFTIFPSIEKFGLDSETFCRRLAEEAKVGVLPGVYFGKEGYIRISMSRPAGMLKAALSRIDTFVKGL